MIDPDQQDDSTAATAGDTLAVPDAPARVRLDDDAADAAGAPEVLNAQVLRAILAAAGPDALTPEETAFLAAADGRGAAGDAQAHHANLAEFVAENDLNRIAQDVISWVDWDEESRADWYAQESRGIKALGVTREVDGGARFEGASTVVHPMLAEACVQFAARSLNKVWPSGGPVRANVVGMASEAVLEQAKRVEQFLNYQYTQAIEGAFQQTDQMLIRLPLSGSVFVKVNYDPDGGITRGMVEPADFLVPYRATDLRTAPRYTERCLLTPNEVRRRQLSGLYRDIKLAAPHDDGDDSERNRIIDRIHDAEGRRETDRGNDDQRHVILECYCELDLPGFEDLRDGEPSGLRLPYVVTVDRDSQKVLAIYRNWRADDVRRKRVVYHVHYKWTPGLGFYGYGLYHWIGGLSRAATGALRALLDAAQFANMQGGFRAKDAKIPNGKMNLAPGEWKEVDTDAEDLAKAFFRLPWSEPSGTLLNLMAQLQDMGRSFAATTEDALGQGNDNTPVGTTLARIEQAGQLQTAIQRRLHEAQGEEFRLVAMLNGEWLPDHYPYAVQGEDRVVARADFDARVDVIPVSDPNFVSNAQRYFMSQAVYQMAQSSPDLFDRYEVNRRVLEALNVDGIDRLMTPRGGSAPAPVPTPQRCDPVTENAMAMLGQPLKAFMEQAHEAHMAVHRAALQAADRQSPQAAILNAHLQEHLALAYLLQMSQDTGIAFQLPGVSDADSAAVQGNLPPAVENRIAQRAAQAVKAQTQAPAKAPSPDPELLRVQAEIARLDLATQAEVARRDAQTRADIERRNAEAQAEIRRLALIGAAQQHWLQEQALAGAAAPAVPQPPDLDEGLSEPGSTDKRSASPADAAADDSADEWADECADERVDDAAATLPAGPW